MPSIMSNFQVNIIKRKVLPRKNFVNGTAPLQKGALKFRPKKFILSYFDYKRI